MNQSVWGWHDIGLCPVALNRSVTASLYPIAETQTFA
jgi:hypothetical protein